MQILNRNAGFQRETGNAARRVEHHERRSSGLRYSDTWQLVINTGTSVATFLMVFLIQNTQNRDTKAVQSAQRFTVVLRNGWPVGPNNVLRVPSFRRALPWARRMVGHFGPTNPRDYAARNCCRTLSLRQIAPHRAFHYNAHVPQMHIR
jgi:hypothetical protein